MKNTEITSKETLKLTTIVGLIFFIVNVITLKWYPLPWLDEVVMTDPVVNYLLTGKLYDTTWIYGTVYPPLYQLLLFGWLKIFGFGIIEVRSLNLVIAFLTSVILFFSLNKYRILKSKTALISALLIFWGSNLFTWMMRNGRVDLLTMLLVLVLFLSFYYFFKDRNRFTFPYITALFIPIAGLQTIPFVFFIIAFCFFALKEYRRVIFKFSLITFLGFLTGVILMLLFFYNFNLLEGFIVNTFFMSKSLMSIISHLNIVDLNNYNEVYPSGLFLEKLFKAYLSNKEYLLLMVANTVIISLLFFKRKIITNSLGLYLYLFALATPLLMTFLAGRYMYTYTWMGFVLSIILIIYLIDKYQSKLKSYIFIVFSLILFTAYPYNFVRNKYESNTKLSTFIKKQNFKKSDYILSCSQTYYDIRIITSNLYFYTFTLYNHEKPLIQVDPARTDTTLRQKINFVIYNPTDIGAEIIMDEITAYKKEGVNIVLKDSLKSPDVFVYQIIK